MRASPLIPHKPWVQESWGFPLYPRYLMLCCYIPIKDSIIKESAGPRHYTEMTRREFLHVPQALSLEDRSENGLFDRSCAQPVSGPARTVELVIELVVDFDVSCCLLNRFVSDPCGTEAVLIDLCSSRNRKGCTSSFWEPQSSQVRQTRSDQLKEAKAKAKERK